MAEKFSNEKLERYEKLVEERLAIELTRKREEDMKQEKLIRRIKKRIRNASVDIIDMVRELVEDDFFENGCVFL